MASMLRWNEKATDKGYKSIYRNHSWRIFKLTVDDRPGGNFMCAKMVIGGAILGAAVAAALVAGSILTGGALAVAAGAAIGAGVGLGVSAIPSICGMLLKDWTPYDKDVLTVGKRPLLENSTIP